MWCERQKDKEKIETIDAKKGSQKKSGTGKTYFFSHDTQLLLNQSTAIE